ncbi:Uncharacterized protein TCM_033659 [Theobroma cacao]|uniref:Uncharacterized protein n=1 Tax=Theobroma cacao TaxID=3641 RepID=A0A061FAD7_THECC|nr:Uncharacterized protein TCM_033659 [Theobroma cacao]
MDSVHDHQGNPKPPQLHGHHSTIRALIIYFWKAVNLFSDELTSFHKFKMCTVIDVPDDSSLGQSICQRVRLTPDMLEGDANVVPNKSFNGIRSELHFPRDFGVVLDPKDGIGRNHFQPPAGR